MNIVNVNIRCAGRQGEYYLRRGSLHDAEGLVFVLDGTGKGFCCRWFILRIDEDVKCQGVFVANIIHYKKLNMVHVNGIGFGSPGYRAACAHGHA